MALWTSVGPYFGGVGTWSNVYVPNGTPVRNARDTVVLEPADEVGGEQPVRLVIGESDELVIDMSASMARTIGAVLATATDAYAGAVEEGGG